MDLLDLLRRYWGYDAFRPKQEAIVQALIAGQDVAVVMPTGGGKSLCYQLPAVALGKTAVVVSPLISLMQDQVEQLRQMGIPSAVLNSSIAPAERSRIARAALNNEFRLIYVSPERIAMDETMGWFRRLPISFFAIDEAHCISEWGHEFRPDYRRLSCLRDALPDKPIAAFTASATKKVRHDILHQLRMQDAGKFIVSFDRPNLRYIARECTNATQTGLLVNAIRAHPDANIIVYAPTIMTVEATVEILRSYGINAVGYHARMESNERRLNQERWMNDEVRVLVGTVAFGLGINKPSVRAVIHLSLPKSLEQYYQEAGRAGRDGLPSDCVLLWKPQDTALLAHFIKQITDREEQQRAWGRYRDIRGYAETNKCRHHQICLHFGETPKWSSCEACDVCQPAPDWLRSRMARGEKKRKAPAEKPSAVARESSVEKPAAVSTGVEKRAAAGGTSTIPPSVKKAGKPLAAEAEPDAALVALVRTWRADVARQNGVPSFVVMHDTSLFDLCRKRPKSLRELLHVSGFGEAKVERYGAAIFELMRRFESGERAQARPTAETGARDVVKMLQDGVPFTEIAAIRKRTVAVVADLAAQLVEQGRVPFRSEWFPPGHLEQIRAACAGGGLHSAKGIKDALPENVTYGEIRLVLAERRRITAAGPDGLEAPDRGEESAREAR